MYCLTSQASPILGGEGGSKITQKNWTLEGKNRTLGGEGGQKPSKIVGHHLCTFPKKDIKRKRKQNYNQVETSFHSNPGRQRKIKWGVESKYVCSSLLISKAAPNPQKIPKGSLIFARFPSCNSLRPKQSISLNLSCMKLSNIYCFI